MKAPRARRKETLPKPRYYIRAVVRQIEGKNHLTRPIPIGEFSSTGNQRGGGWASFIPPGESIEVRLHIPEGGQPSEAMREWFIRREAGRARRGVFDLIRLAPLWNIGSDTSIRKRECGDLHLSGTRTVSWGPDIVKAISVWAEAGQIGPYPPDLLAWLEPDQYAPFLPRQPRPKIPAKNRWLYVAIDIARPLEEQLRETKDRCTKIRDYALMLARQKPQRAGRHEVRRDILAFTLHYSAGRTIAQVAEEVFPGESSESSERKVKDILRRVRRALPPDSFTGNAIRLARRNKPSP